MASNNFEKYIKENLDNRTLQPSADAWDTLSKRLDNQAKKSKKVNYLWLGLAASFVGVLLVSTLFFNTKEIVNDNPVIVNTPQIIEEKEKEVEVVVNKEMDALTQEDTQSVERVLVVNIRNSIPAELNNDEEEPAETVIKELSFEEQKIQEVVAEIQQLKDNNSHVSDSEIDALLIEAQKEINLNKLYNNKGLVDATLLLQEVEADLDQSFRSKVFEALKDGFGTVKSAVANRNN